MRRFSNQYNQTCQRSPYVIDVLAPAHSQMTRPTKRKQYATEVEKRSAGNTPPASSACRESPGNGSRIFQPAVGRMANHIRSSCHCSTWFGGPCVGLLAEQIGLTPRASFSKGPRPGPRRAPRNPTGLCGRRADLPATQICQFVADGNKTHRRAWSLGPDAKPISAALLNPDPRGGARLRAIDFVESFIRPMSGGAFLRSRKMQKNRSSSCPRISAPFIQIAAVTMMFSTRTIRLQGYRVGLFRCARFAGS